jgi:hypothetical protein
MAKSDVLTHGRLISGARALHAEGHISTKQKDRIVSKSQGAIQAMKRAQPKRTSPTGVTKESSVKVKTKTDQPDKTSKPTAKSRNQPCY